MLSAVTFRRLLAALLINIVSLGVAHTSWDDAACDPILVHHDHNAHRLHSGTLPAHAPDHCLFCHSLRSLGTGLAAISAAVVDASSATTLRTADTALASRLLDSYTPSRAPPAFLL